MIFMEKRMLGKSDLNAFPFALGANVFGWTIDKEKSFEILDKYLALGFELIDTADVYSTWGPGNHGGESESIIGEWIKSRGNRNKLILATKVGKPMSPTKKGLSRKYIREAIDASLKRLQTDYIDLYQSHEDDTQTPLEETMEAFTEMIRSGKVRTIGASNYSPARFSESLDISHRYGYARYECLQPAYNLYSRAFEKDYQSICLSNGIGVISYYALASGFLSGKYRSEADLGKSARGAGIKKYLNAKGFSILAALDKIAKNYHTTQASIAIAWILQNPAITAPIASATSIVQLEEITKAVEIKLDAGSVEELNRASDIER
jgi:aryl-alcohol dehydrogenase-like predicted oxidoreductase